MPVPLAPAVWSAAVFGRPVTSRELVDAVLTDRRAALLSFGLAALDDPTLEYLETHPLVLTRLYQRSAAAFAAFGGSLHIADGRVAVPGGEPAAPLWEAVVGASLTAPDRFVPLLFGEQTGRLAYLFDTVAALDGPNAAFALGLWLPDGALRIERFKALAAVASREYREWKLEAGPFGRPIHDLALLLLRLRVDAQGIPAPPADRAFWIEAFGTGRSARASTAPRAQGAAGAQPAAAGPAEGPAGGPGRCRLAGREHERRQHVRTR